MENIILKINGMKCTGCSQRVERALKNTDGIEYASVNLETREANITYNKKIFILMKYVVMYLFLLYSKISARNYHAGAPCSKLQVCANTFFVQVALVNGVKVAPKPSCYDAAFVVKIEKLFFG